MTDAANDWYQGDSDDEDDGFRVTEYDITASPNDFNTKTILDFIDSGVVDIPPFQRNFVWDRKRASKLIESIIIGLPIPQIFLYEKSRNKFLVIDGQQRLLSMYYFRKGRFPKPQTRTALRKMMMTMAAPPEDLMNDNNYFTGFKLSLPTDPGVPKNIFDGMTYQTLGDYQTTFDLRTIRNIVVKQNAPSGDDSIYEIFNRLNSGGMNLTPQEIRMSLYHSTFLKMLTEMNFDPRWRHLLGSDAPDLHLRDVEFLLRGFALAYQGNDYSPSMAKFLNGFANKAKTYSDDQVASCKALLGSFLDACVGLPPTSFHGVYSTRFTITMFDGVFASVVGDAIRAGGEVCRQIESDKLDELKSDREFREATMSRTTGTGNVKLRIMKASAYIHGGVE